MKKAAGIIHVTILFLTLIGLTYYVRSKTVGDDIFGDFDFVAMQMVLYCLGGESLLFESIRCLVVFRNAGFGRRLLLLFTAVWGLAAIVLSLDFIFRGHFYHNHFATAEIALVILGWTSILGASVLTAVLQKRRK